MSERGTHGNRKKRTGPRDVEVFNAVVESNIPRTLTLGLITVQVNRRDNTNTQLARGLSVRPAHRMYRRSLRKGSTAARQLP